MDRERYETLYGLAWRESAALEGHICKMPARASSAAEKWSIQATNDARLRQLWHGMGDQEWTVASVSQKILFSTRDNSRHALDRLLAAGSIEARSVVRNSRRHKIFRRVEPVQNTKLGD